MNAVLGRDQRPALRGLAAPERPQVVPDFQTVSGEEAPRTYTKIIRHASSVRLHFHLAQPRSFRCHFKWQTSCKSALDNWPLVPIVYFNPWPGGLNGRSAFVRILSSRGVSGRTEGQACAR